MAALVGGERYPLQHIEAGLFAVALPFTDLVDYRLEVSYPAADDAPHVHTVADAYRFLPTLGEIDLHLFAEGRHERLWEILGAHPRSFTTADGVVDGRVVRGVGAECQGRQPDRRLQPLGRQRGADARARARRASGSCSGPDFPTDGLYKFRVHGADGSVTDRADPMAFATEVPPQTASRVTESDYTWDDDGLDGPARRSATRCSSR